MNVALQSIQDLAEAALLSLERLDTVKLAGTGQYLYAESVGNARRLLDRLLLELERVQARTTVSCLASDQNCLICHHDRRFYNAEADACEHTTGLTKIDVFCGCACRFSNT